VPGDLANVEDGLLSSPPQADSDAAIAAAAKVVSLKTLMEA
jgi:hypothetical protein